MTVRDLISKLKNFNQDREVVLFDNESNPYEILSVVNDTKNNGTFSHIVIIQT